MPGIAKVLKGILHFQKKDKAKLLTILNRLQKDSALSVYFTCMDHRVLASGITNSSAGDHYIVRNAGNFVPPAQNVSPESVSGEAGALELGCVLNKIQNIVVCGHSECKAMGLLYNKRHDCHNLNCGPLEMWVKKQGSFSAEKFNALEAANKLTGPLVFNSNSKENMFEAFIDPEGKFGPVDKLSQVNCLQQIENISTYPFMKEKLEAKKVRLHALWFDLYVGDMYMFSRQKKRFLEITEETVPHLLTDAGSTMEEMWKEVVRDF